MSPFRLIIHVTACTVLCCVSVAAYADDNNYDHHHQQHDCESWESASIASINENEGKIMLDDGSIWRTDMEGAEVIEEWKPNDSIDICNDRMLTNDDEGESIYARQIR